jgi:hypothetical protein
LPQDDLFSAGEFGTAGGSAANSIAKWNGSSWSALEAGMGRSSYIPFVLALTTSASSPSGLENDFSGSILLRALAAHTKSILFSSA